MDDYVIRVDMKNVAEGDATEVAQNIWDENSEGYDAPSEFDVSISKDGFQLDWEPRTDKYEGV